jgi:hypothetical protein
MVPRLVRVSAGREIFERSAVGFDGAQLVLEECSAQIDDSGAPGASDIGKT